MNIAIVKYNAGNIQSVLYALERIGLEAIVTDDHTAIQSADKVIFPGVGEASTAMQYLNERNLNQLLVSLKQPVLGICLGMQLMCSYSEENDTDCLNIFQERVKRFNPTVTNAAETPVIDGEEMKTAPLLKVPQIGWNTIYDLKTPLFKNVPENAYVYAVHSYYAALGDHTIATTNYVQPYSAGLHRENFYGVQFHPEKSAAVGEQILENFLSI